MWLEKVGKIFRVAGSCIMWSFHFEQKNLVIQLILLFCVFLDILINKIEKAVIIYFIYGLNVTLIPDIPK